MSLVTLLNTKRNALFSFFDFSHSCFNFSISFLITSVDLFVPLCTATESLCVGFWLLPTADNKFLRVSLTTRNSLFSRFNTATFCSRLCTRCFFLCRLSCAAFRFNSKRLFLLSSLEFPVLLELALLSLLNCFVIFFDD